MLPIVSIGSGMNLVLFMVESKTVNQGDHTVFLHHFSGFTVSTSMTSIRRIRVQKP